MCDYRTQRIFVPLVIAGVFVIGFLCQQVYVFQVRDSSLKPMNTTANTEVGVKFIYHTQTAQCLSAYHFRSDIVGDPEKCRCLVVVLSYKKVCTNNSYPHVRYFYAPHTTLNVGRNMLHNYTAKNLANAGAVYYIFIDADAHIQRTRTDLLDVNVRDKVDSQLPILRQFENFLLENKPAVSTSIYSTSTNAHVFKEDFFSTCCTMRNGSTMLFPEFFPMISYDLCMFAHHVNASPHLFPIPVKYESKSWWMGDVIMPFRVYVKYRGQAVVYSPMHILNSGHSVYPKVGGGVVGYDVLMKEERDLAPVSLRGDRVWEDPLFIRRRQPPYYSMINPQFKYVPYNKNPAMLPYYGLLKQ